MLYFYDYYRIIFFLFRFLLFQVFEDAQEE